MANGQITTAAVENPSRRRILAAGLRLPIRRPLITVNRQERMYVLMWSARELEYEDIAHVIFHVFNGRHRLGRQHNEGYQQQMI